MSDRVKTAGKGSAGRRGEQARATRRRIIDAAADLFIESGYAATTLEQVADRAGVAVQTVYFHFRNKHTVLEEAVDVAAVGDDEPIPLLDRPWLEEIRAEPDPQRMVALWVRSSRTILGRIAPIMSVVRDAVGVDPDMAAQWDTNQRQRTTAFRLFTHLLAERDVGGRGHRHRVHPAQHRGLPAAHRHPRLDPGTLGTLDHRHPHNLSAPLSPRGLAGHV
jgi:AcrR family transcriptional regulator